MGRQETLGFVLIAAVLMAWMYFTSPQRQPQQAAQTTQSIVHDSVKRTESSPRTEQQRIAPSTPSQTQSQTTQSVSDTLGKFFSGTEVGREQTFTVETENYIAELSTKGGLIKQWTLKNHKTWDNHPVQLVNDSNGDFNILFTTTDGKMINTKNHFFTTQLPIGGKIILSGSEETVVQFVLNGSEGRIVKKLTFKNQAFDFDADIAFEGMQSVVANYEYQILWENGVRYTEYNSVDESSTAAAYTYGGGELKEVNAAAVGENPKEDPSGQTEWVALRNKYFAVALLSQDKKATGAYLEGQHILTQDNGVVEKYSVALKYPFKNTANETAKISTYIGPLKFSTIKSYDRGLDQIMSLGWSWIRPITEYIFIPLFALLHSVISNYGIVIIIFSILIKLALYPLTKSSMASMRKMQKLQPLMAEIREKYKSDAQQMNIQVMKLYKDYGVNPAGGCLPMLLQLPILYALYSLFTASIELRQEHFMLWVTDLSVPDVLISLPFSLPLLGNFISGLTVAMGVTMFIQQKQTVTDPTQKALVWMMPIMMTVMFNHFPSGLNLYYFVFNLLSIGQQWYFNQRHNNEPLQKIPENQRKTGFMERMQRNLPKQSGK
ncbi:MAG: membrane protein insertase YidC [Bacteroidota bacterium]|nr:membrane protein insertase YidC [Bacteroidota bacterium]